ncbi:unnamed protein product (macronuclear) [Paramecium tetraurelia]|uniref:Dynein heavy chain linker domain-containing protein n=1 Tax=Paramecium tetraurelia TaxID=5888 RepID=A0DE95_PARTE|nr:uncharacterized protein GSPATT00039446001 [Paramecium tetraurelia]CAK81362.1 unnamed protein product [Paramecium tetraurelia]|eukprot:XP_001448759.1 hypothetical protein (macronuclear) [Paramecium tetraurelia strain d4-2]
MYQEAEKLNKIYNIEIDRIGHGHKLLSYFQNQVNQLYSYYVNKNDELQQHFNDLPLKEIILIKFQLETITSIEDLNKIKLAFFDRNFLKYFEILRQKNLTLQLKLVTTKKSFQMILQKVSREEQRMFLDVLKFEEFLLNVITNVPKRLMRENTNFDLPLHTELQNLQISYEDFKQKLPKQKGAITYLIIRQKINEKKIDSQRKDLELIEKELGELFIKEPSFLFVDKFQTIFEGLNVDEQLRVDTFNLPEKEKYKKFLYQLKQIENLRKCQQINNWNSLIIQTETVIEAIETFGQTDKEIDKMLIHEDLIMLKENIYKVFKEEQELIPISQNQIILEREEIRDDQSYRTYLQFMIKIVKLKKLQLLEELEFLNKLLEKFDSFSRKLDKILRYEEEYQNKLYFRFQDCTKECIQRFEESQLINDNVNQKEDENFQQYLERIETQFFRRGNVNVIYQAQIKISDFLNQIVACVKQVEFKYCTSTQIESDYLIQQLNTIYLEDIEVLEDEEESDQQLGLSNNLIFKIKDVITNDQWKIKQGLVFTIIQITSSCYSRYHYFFLLESSNLIMGLRKRSKSQKSFKKLTIDKHINVDFVERLVQLT